MLALNTHAFLDELLQRHIRQIFDDELPPQPPLPATHEPPTPEAIYQLLERTTAIINTFSCKYAYEYDDLYQECYLAIHTMLQRVSLIDKTEQHITHLVKRCVRFRCINKTLAENKRRQRMTSLEKPLSEDGDELLTLAELLPAIDYDPQSWFECKERLVEHVRAVKECTRAKP